jgi:hypothetical protein
MPVPPVLLPARHRGRNPRAASKPRRQLSLRRCRQPAPGGGGPRIRRWWGGSWCATTAAPAGKEAVVSSAMGSWDGGPRSRCCGGLLLSPRGGRSGVLESGSAGEVGRQIVVAARRIVVAAQRQRGSGSGVVLRELAALWRGAARWSLWSTLPGRSAGHQPPWALLRGGAGNATCRLCCRGGLRLCSWCSAGLPMAGVSQQPEDAGAAAPELPGG